MYLHTYYLGKQSRVDFGMKCKIEQIFLSTSVQWRGGIKKLGLGGLLINNFWNIVYKGFYRLEQTSPKELVTVYVIGRADL